MWPFRQHMLVHSNVGLKLDDSLVALCICLLESPRDRFETLSAPSSVDPASRRTFCCGLEHPVLPHVRCLRVLFKSPDLLQYNLILDHTSEENAKPELFAVHMRCCHRTVSDLSKAY